MNYVKILIIVYCSISVFLNEHNSNGFGLDFRKRCTYSPGPFPLAPSKSILVPSCTVVAVTARDRRGVEARVLDAKS